jgi:TonB family protein
MSRASITVPLALFVSLSLVVWAFPQIPTQSRAGVEINKEPILNVQLQAELVEISAAGTRSLGRSFGTTLSADHEGGGNLTMEGVASIRIKARLAQVQRDSLVLELTVAERETGTVLASQSLALANRQEAIVELATAVTGGSRIAVRFIPSIIVKEAVEDYPEMLPEFGIENSMLIRNDKEVLIRISGHASVPDLSGNTLPFFEIMSPRTGDLCISYRPFPGASLCGYIEGKRMLFEWEGDTYEWFSMDTPILPREGRWAVYVGRVGSVSAEGFTAGFRVARLKDLEEIRTQQEQLYKAAPGSGEPVYRIGSGVSEPEAILQPKPRYSPEARANKVEGIMLLQAVIDKDGTVRDAKILRGLGYGLDESAIDTMTKQWRFKPGTYNGQPVAVQVNIEITFRLY